MSAVFSFIFGLVKAVPIINSWLKQFIAAYLAREMAEHRNDMAEALTALIKDHDQSILERAIGSNNAGKPTIDRTDVDEVSAGDFER